MRLATFTLGTCLAACAHTRAPESVPTRMERTPPPTSAHPPPATAPAASEQPDVTIEDLLGAAGDLTAFALFREYDFDPDGQLLIVSGTPDTGQAVSCIQSAQRNRCIEHAGFGRVHLLRTLRDDSRPTVTAPAWASSLLAAAANAPDVDSIELFNDEVGPLLMANGTAGSRFALRRDRRWRLSEAKTGGKALAPFYFGSLDTTRATNVPSIGLMLGHYAKESCVRSETVELVVLEIGDALEDLGSVVIGRGEWLALDQSFAPFDPKDPNHYRIQLRPRVQHDGTVRFEIESRHTPKPLRNRKHACGVELAPRTVDDVMKLVGIQQLAPLLQTPATEE